MLNIFVHYKKTSKKEAEKGKRCHNCLEIEILLTFFLINFLFNWKTSSNITYLYVFFKYF